MVKAGALNAELVKTQRREKFCMEKIELVVKAQISRTDGVTMCCA
jgi:hypothetical protein